MYDNNQVFNVLSLLQESHRTHLLIKNTPEGVVKFLQWYCVFCWAKEGTYSILHKRVICQFIYHQSLNLIGIS
jgi:hypothetical protein